MSQARPGSIANLLSLSDLQNLWVFSVSESGFKREFHGRRIIIASTQYQTIPQSLDSKASILHDSRLQSYTTHCRLVKHLWLILHLLGCSMLPGGQRGLLAACLLALPSPVTALAESLPSPLNRATELARQGENLGFQQKVDEASAAFNEASGLYQKLHDQNPGDIGYRQGLASCYEKFGDMLVGNNQLDRGLATYQKARNPASPRRPSARGSGPVAAFDGESGSHRESVASTTSAF